MSKGEHRRFTAEQKLEVLREAEQPRVTVSQVCRRHALAPSVFYRWRAVAQSGSAVALTRHLPLIGIHRSKENTEHSIEEIGGEPQFKPLKTSPFRSVPTLRKRKGHGFNDRES